MKARFLILILSLMVLYTYRAEAQVDVTINPVGLLFGDLSVGGDFILSDEFSIEGTLGFGSGSDDFTNLKWRNIPITAVGKYYFNPDDGADKFYASAFLRFINRGYTADDDTQTTYAEYSQTRFGLGVGIGYKAVSRSGIVFDIGLGVGRALLDNTKFESDGEEFIVEWPEIMFTGKLGVGYRFGG
ncbi:MAG: DUF3575 domain-containing protein [Bacteroidetes bacterium]|nr:MAG: DUF3575 domain-containing protein [Bacteroidota bacterium]